MHKLIVCILGGCLTIGSCSFYPQKQSNEISNNYISLCYGFKTSVDTNNFMEHALYLLNASRYKECLNLFKNQYPVLDTLWDNNHNQYGLTIPVPRTYPPYNPLTYLSFRYNNFLNNLPTEFQNNILLDGINFDYPDSLVKLQKVESITLRYNKFFHPDSVIAKQVIVAVQSLQKEIKGSRRLDYILATAYLMLGNDTEAFPIYDKLINENYYAIPCLKNCMKYLNERNRMSEQQKYIILFTKMFPNETIQ